jgi:hypothetical protein
VVLQRYLDLCGQVDTAAIERTVQRTMGQGWDPGLLLTNNHNNNSSSSSDGSAMLSLLIHETIQVRGGGTSSSSSSNGDPSPWNHTGWGRGGRGH